MIPFVLDLRYGMKMPLFAWGGSPVPIVCEAGWLLTGGLTSVAKRGSSLIFRNRTPVLRSSTF